MYYLQRFNYSYFFLFLLLLASIFNIFANVISLPYLSILSLLATFFFMKKEDRGFILVMYSTVFGGYFAQLGVRGIGWLLLFIGIIALLPDLTKEKRKFQRPVILGLITILFLSFSVLFTVGGDFAVPKLVDTIITTVCCLVAFGHLIAFPQKHDGTSLSLMLLVYAAFMLSYISELIGGLTLLDVISFGSFRSELSMAKEVDEQLFTYNYQTIGLYACVALCLFFVGKKRKLNMMAWLIIVASGLLVLCCQSRQGLLSFVILLLFLLTDFGNIKLGKIISICLVLFVLYYWLNTLDDTVVDFVTGQEEFGSYSKRSSIRQTAYKTFLSHPIFGVGYGRFIFDFEYGENIHNLFYEILAETGLVGAVFFSFVTYVSFKGIRLKKLIREYYWLIAIIIAFFLRLMISSDLREGIGLFVLFFLLIVSNNKENVRKINTITR